MANDFEKKALDHPQAHTHVWRVTGLDCPSCAREFELAIQEKEGIHAVELDFMGSILRVLCSLEEDCEEIIAGLGRDHGVELSDPKAKPGESSDSWPVEAWIMLGSGAFLLASWISGFREFLIPSLLIAGFPVTRKAMGDLRRRDISMNVLMTIACIGAFFLGEWQEGTMVMFLFSIARWLERLSSERARQSIEALKLQLPATANVIDPDGASEETLLENVRIKALVRVKPGDRVPLDGRVVSGKTAVDESSLTGEADHVPKEPGCEVFAGTWNQDGVIDIEVSAVSTESRFSRIMLSVEKAQAAKTEYQGSVERFAAIYTPTVVFIALLVAVLPPLVMGTPFSPWIYSSLVLLVIACPCALVISAPVTLVASMATAAREGILLRGGDILEATADVKLAAFDKTGTITLGTPRIVEIIPVSGCDEKRLLVLATALEAHSEHPIARAFMKKSREEGLKLPEVTDFLMLKGKGIEGTIDRKRFRFGKPEWALEISPGGEQIKIPSSGGLTVSMLCDESGPLGFITFGDQIRPEAKPALDLLKRYGVVRTALLSGDRQEVANEFGSRVGIDECHGSLLPEEKSRLLEEFRRNIGPTLMLGDGINDTPALAAAHVGVAMGDRGNDAVLETAGAVLLYDDLARLPKLFAIAHRSRRLIRQNIAIAVGLKLAVFGLSLAGMGTLWMAIMADTGASVLVVMNGLRGLRIP